MKDKDWDSLVLTVEKRARAFKAAGSAIVAFQLGAAIDQMRTVLDEEDTGARFWNVDYKFPPDEPSIAFIELAAWPRQKGIEFFFSLPFRQTVRTFTVSLAGYLAEVQFAPEFFPRNQIGFLQKSLFSVGGNFQNNPFVAGASFAAGSPFGDSKMPDPPHKMFLDLCNWNGQFTHFFAPEGISHLFSFLESGLKVALDDPKVRNTISQLGEQLVELQAAEDDSKMAGERAAEIITNGLGRQKRPSAATRSKLSKKSQPKN